MGLGAASRGVTSQERLESLEVREAIYESHGIMTSAEKKIFNSDDDGDEVVKF